MCQASLMALREVPAVELDAFLVLLCRHLLTLYGKESLLYHIQVRFHTLESEAMAFVIEFHCTRLI
jgi:hypothetical protein